MKLPRRKFLHLAAGAATIPAVSRFAWAQTYPTRPVRLIIPFAPGGGGDAVGRPLAIGLSEVWGQQIVVENKAGVGGNIGSQAVAQSAPDGYTILLGSATLAINPSLYTSAGYNPLTDLAPVTLLTIIPNLMMVPNSSPARSVTEFIAYGKANPGKLTFASTGIGASPHLSGELFKRMAGIELTHVPYRGAGPAMNDLIPGRVDAMFSNLPGVLPQVQSGTVRGLAVTSAKRSLAAPDIPTIGESLPGYEVSGWWALLVPAKTPTEIVMKLHDDTVAALAHLHEQVSATGIHRLQRNHQGPQIPVERGATRSAADRIARPGLRRPVRSCENDKSSTAPGRRSAQIEPEPAGHQRGFRS